MYNDAHLKQLFLHHGGRKKYEEKFVSTVRSLIEFGYRLERNVPKKSLLDGFETKYSDLENMELFIFSPGFPNVEFVEENKDGSITFWIHDGDKITELSIRRQLQKSLAYWTGKDEFSIWYEVICDAVPKMNPHAWIQKT